MYARIANEAVVLSLHGWYAHDFTNHMFTIAATAASEESTERLYDWIIFNPSGPV